MKLTPTLLLLLGIIFSSLIVMADCGCSHTIALGTHQADGRQMQVQPGDTVCIEAGRRHSLRLENFKGSAEKPVVLINCGGKVTLGGPVVNNGILILESRYFRLSGSGDPDHPYGIHIVETKDGSQGIAATGFSSDFEIDHIEIENAGFAGIMAKTDPLCDGSADRGNFTMYNISLHHNYIHDVKGEGIYLGNSFYTGTEVYCKSFHLPHELKGVRVHDNIVENAGWEAIQVGSAVEDCEIFNNKVINYGTANKSSQNGGIQLGLGTTGRVYGNHIERGHGAAIVIQGIGANYIYNNLIISPGQEAFNINTREPMEGKGVYIINNTVVNAQKGVIREYVNPAKNNVFFNNLLLGCAPDWNLLKPYTDWKLENNLLAPIEGAYLLDARKGDYRLKPESKAVNAGRDVAAYGIHADFDNCSRPSGKGFDIGAFELNSNIW